MQGFEKVALKAQRQAGMVSRQQLLAMGFSRDALRRALEAKVLVKSHRGVYRLPGAPLTYEARLWAALLWANLEAALSHRTAGWAWSLSGVGTRAPWPIELVTAADNNWHPPAGVRLHRTRHLEKRSDLIERDGLPCTSLPRTLVDLAGVLNASNLEKAVDSARRKHDVADEQALEALDRLGHQGRAGAAKLVVVATREPVRRTGSELEQDVRDAMDAAKIRWPVPQLSLEDIHGDQIGVVDFTWPECNVVLFVQSGRWHRTSGAFEKDNVQMSSLAAKGWRVMRITHRRLQTHPQEFFAELRAVLSIDKNGSVVL